MNDEQVQTVMSIIINAGEARSKSLEAIESIIKNDKEKCEECLKQAHLSLVEAHNDQTKLICLEANESDVQLNLITIHSKDHLMTSLVINDLTKEIVKLTEKVNMLETKLNTKV